MARSITDSVSPLEGMVQPSFIAIHDLKTFGMAGAQEVAILFARQKPKYLRFFTPFSAAHATDAAGIWRLIEKAQKDLYLGLIWQGRLGGILMLRGYDEGYSVPAIGLMVGEEYQGLGLAAVAVEAGLAIARGQKAKKVLAKVHLANDAAYMRFWKHDFRPTELPVNREGYYFLEHNLEGMSFGGLRGRDAQHLSEVIERKYGFKPPETFAADFVAFLGQM